MEEMDKMRQRTAELEVAEDERKRAEERNLHLNAILRAVRNVNQFIIKVKGREKLLQGVYSKLIG